MSTLATFKLTSIIVAVSAVSLASQFVLADHDLPIELVEVTDKQHDQNIEKLFSDTPLTKPTHDAGELLRSVTGMTALRRGGRGFDPIVRGQSQSNLNVIANGGFSFGACPGRMDPPSTYVGIDSFDSVSVIKGHRSVIYGSGGSGGTLLFEHERPDFGKSGVKGSLSTGYTDNSGLKNLAADIAMGNDSSYVRVFGSNKRGGNYEDGNGNDVASAFDSDSFGIVVGTDLGDADYVQLAFERSFEDDVWYAGNGMDAVFADSRNITAKWLHQEKLWLFNEINLTVYKSDVEHLMDNYSVRERTMMPNGAAAPSASDTQGGRLLLTIDGDNSQWHFGLDHKANDQKAELYMDVGKDGSYNMLMARMWPDVELRQSGLFAELDYTVSGDDTLRLGLRWDEFEARALSSSAPAGMMGSATPANLYQRYYAAADDKQKDDGLSVVLGWDRRLNHNLLLSANLSRSVRAPDVTEQWIARAARGRFWVGNPEINAETHQQLDLSLISNGANEGWSATLFYNNVDDFIERYQQGPATLYRNIDAKLYGLELDANFVLASNLTARIGVSYTRGDGDNGDLAQISPVEARMNFDYTRERWAMGVEWLVSAKQTHFDPDVDVAEETRGFGVVHVYAHWSVTKHIVLEAGVENFLDSAYAYHVNAGNADPFNPDAVRVFEPGRQGWLKARYQF